MQQEVLLEQSISGQKKVTEQLFLALFQSVTSTGEAYPWSEQPTEACKGERVASGHTIQVQSCTDNNHYSIQVQSLTGHH